MLARLLEMKRTDIEKSFTISGQKGKEGTTFLAKMDEYPNEKYAVKLFKKTKSADKMEKEARLQQMAADNGVAPAVRGVSKVGKFIVMDALKETIVAKAWREKWTELPSSYKAMLYALCVRLDQAGVLQNDGNPLNLMVDDTGRLYIIDYGFAKDITTKVKKKRGPQPNITLTLWSFSRELKRYRITNDIRSSICEKYEENHAFKDEQLLAAGEELLGGVVKPNVQPVPKTRTKPRTKSRTKPRTKSRKTPNVQPTPQSNTATATTVDTVKALKSEWKRLEEQGDNQKQIKRAKKKYKMAKANRKQQKTKDPSPPATVVLASPRTKHRPPPVALPTAAPDVQSVTKKKRRRARTPPSRTRPSTKPVIVNKSQKTTSLATFTQHAKPPQHTKEHALTKEEKIQLRIDRHNRKKKTTRQ